MRLLIIRHDESAADLLDVHEGRADFELTERGHSQAIAMSEYVGEHYRISKIYHSTLKRAAQTAAHLSEATRAPLFPDDKGDTGIHEWIITGCTRCVAKANYLEHIE